MFVLNPFEECGELTAQQRELLEALDSPDFEQYEDAFNVVFHAPIGSRRLTYSDSSGYWHNAVRLLEG